MDRSSKASLKKVESNNDWGHYVDL
jgi:hypothetical protein